MKSRTHIRIFIAIVALMTFVTVHADKLPIGTWKVYPMYVNPPQKIIDTEDIVYYVSGGSLFSYDKENDENYSYTIDNKLNDVDIIDIYYNFEKNYLVVCYESGNIDILYDDGRVKNLSDIKDSKLSPPLTITNVCFDGDLMYAATSFGIVKFNILRAEVVTSGNYGKKVNSLCILGDKLVIHSDGSVWWTDKENALNSWKIYNKMYDHNVPLEMIPVSDNEMIVHLNHTEVMLALHTLNYDEGTMIWNPFTATHERISKYLSHGKDGKIYYIADNNLYTVSDDYKEQKLSALTDEVDWEVYGTYTGENDLWALTRQGLSNYSFDGEGGMTLKMESFKPEAFSVDKVRFFYPSADGKRLYGQNSGITSYRFEGSTRGLEYAQTAGCLDLTTGEMTDVTAYPVEAAAPIVEFYQRSAGKYALSTIGLSENPKDKSVYFLGTADDGILRVRDGKVEGRYNHLNSPIEYHDERDIFYGISTDRVGNLWASAFHNLYTLSPIMILPADKANIDVSNVKKEDWIHPDLSGIDYWGGMDCKMLHCRHSNLVLIIQSSNELFVCDTRGTYSNFSDDRYYLWEKMTDQDGNILSNVRLSAICEDLNGRIWIGTNNGVFELNPANALNPKAVFTHLKVPRNDGTNLADYLLGTDLIMDIAVDAANRKWIATYGSGVFLVNAAGNEILENFTENNSMLPSSKVNCIYVDNYSGTVYIGTDKGLVSYTSDATPAEENYDNIFVYPNPVKPEYRGEVNITGLMENTLVKIADTAGQVVAQGRSEGGRFVWNACNSAGRRVKTGVYYVLVSQNASGNSSAAVAKIMVVN